MKVCHCWWDGFEFHFSLHCVFLQTATSWQWWVLLWWHVWFQGIMLREICVCGRQIVFISLMLKHSYHKEQMKLHFCAKSSSWAGLAWSAKSDPDRKIYQEAMQCAISGVNIMYAYRYLQIIFFKKMWYFLSRLKLKFTEEILRSFLGWETLTLTGKRASTWTSFYRR